VTSARPLRGAETSGESQSQSTIAHGRLAMPNMLWVELRHLRCFVAVAEQRHFGRGAERLLLSTPTVSQQVRALEREIGVDLLIRSPRGTQLTAAGSALLPQARRTLAAADRALAAAREAGGLGADGPRLGLLHGVPAWLPEQLEAAVLEALPRARPILRTGSTSEQLLLLQHGELDVAMVRSPVPLTARTVFEPVISEELGILVDVRHPLAQHPVLQAAQLTGRELIWYPRDRAPGAHDATLAALRAAGADVVLSATTTTMGQHPQTLALRPDAFSLGSARAAVSPNVVWRPLQGRPLHAEVGLLWPRRPGSPRRRVTAALQRHLATRAALRVPGETARRDPDNNQ